MVTASYATNINIPVSEFRAKGVPEATGVLEAALGEAWAGVDSNH